MAGLHTHLLAAGALLWLGALPATAFDYPNRPITLIVAHGPGGPSDVIARVLGRLLTPILKQPIIVENRPGASGNIAGESAAHANSDGYTLLLGNTSILAANSRRGKDAAFDPQLDFTPITLIGTQANALVVTPSFPVQSVLHLVEMARAKPGSVTYASAGHGSASHLAGELFRAQARANLVHVPYKKPAPALQDVVGGHVNMMFAPAAQVANHVRHGRLRTLGLGSAARSDALPGIATLDELGVAGFDATTWYGLVAPAGTPREIVDLLYHSVGAALENPSPRRIMAGLGIDVVSSSPKAFEAYIATQIPKWSAVLKAIAYTH